MYGKGWLYHSPALLHTPPIHSLTHLGSVTATSRTGSLLGSLPRAEGPAPGSTALMSCLRERTRPKTYTPYPPSPRRSVGPGPSACPSGLSDEPYQFWPQAPCCLMPRGPLPPLKSSSEHKPWPHPAGLQSSGYKSCAFLGGWRQTREIPGNPVIGEVRTRRALLKHFLSTYKNVKGCTGS